ncbi:TIGR03086 family protein [Mycobacterium sp. IS-2888]|uniref:TIGR03086 family metal-binding protein n=1 Tax=unclassified Mycobacterium TaxID=2642494 RepID=UPI00096D651F|nr:MULTISPECIES: TIGR03086 family metal-binding protein [unclassified Mycobacterium]OMC43523.1 TIGR03086 family protein [Mycobacterium sp. IS-1264]OMC46313.1 TIGR03086 family protein [Mycobacterium sp. IS-2888]
MDPLSAHQRAQDAFARVLANVSPDQLGAPTPCSEWTIGDLIEHVIGGNEHVGLWAQTPIEPPARPDDLVAAHRGSAAAAQAVFAGPDGMSMMFKLPFAEIPGQMFIGLRTSDVLTHAWDLATATGQSTDLDPELAGEQLAAVRAFVGPQFRGPGKPFAEEQPCPPERASADQLAAFLGRKVQ